MAETALITINDVQNYRRISSQIESERFDAFVMKAQRQNLRQLLGQSLYYAFMDDSRASGIYKDLLDGKTYTYNGETIEYYGIKPYLCYVWLAIFAREGDYFQANVGNISFSNNPQQNMVQVSEATRRAVVSSFMESASEYENDIIRFLNEHSTDYTLWEGASETKITRYNLPDPV